MIGHICFVSSDQSKSEDVCNLLKPHGIEVELSDLKIDEIQHIDIEEITIDKAIRAFQRIWRPVLVEQTGLYLEDFGGLPGGLTRIFWDKLGPETFSRYFGEQAVVAKSVFAYCDGKGIFVYSGELPGVIVAPKGSRSFGWDCVFRPEGSSLTLAEMPGGAEKHVMRKRALEEFIKQQGGTET